MYRNFFALIIALFAGIASAVAIPSSFSIDLRSATWNSAIGTTQDTQGNVTAFTAFPPGSVLTWSSTDGIGINAPGILALSPLDILNISFANGSGNGLTGAWVTNLFSGSAEAGVLELVTRTGTDIIDFSGQNSNSSGQDYISFGGALDVLTAEFCAVNPTGQLFNQSYSVAGFSAVPDGGTTLTLLGIGLIGLTTLRRRVSL
jgi:hypothetical protein